MGLVIDLFAGGGGASLGLEWAGFPVDIAINHDLEAITMHLANHPNALHFCENILDVDPKKVVGGRPVDIIWASPDCKHFSKAKGAALVDRNIRSLAWVVVKWAKLTRPRVIMLENVEEFATWGPVVAGRPDPKRKGMIFEAWKNALENLGYEVDHRQLRACDFGAPTIRKRLFVVARCDGEPIVWPESTHGPDLIPYRTAAECIDFSIPCPSIFERKRPLAENTLRRIAKGIQKFVIDAAEPFIVTYYGDKRGEFRGQSIHEPLKTQTAENRHALVVPSLLHNTTHHRPGNPEDPLATVTTGNHHYLVAAHLARHFGQSVGSNCQGPAPTVTAGGMGKTALVSAFLTKHFGTTIAQEADEPLHTITGKTKHGLVTSHLMKLRGTCRHGQQTDAPAATITSGGTHLAEVRAFLIKYYSSNIGHDLREPIHTLTTKHRLGLVTVHDEDYQIVDIGMRMLSPRELFRAQGFPDSYVIDPEFKGKPLTKTSQVRLCGNSVPPQFVQAIARSNCDEAQRIWKSAQL